MIVKLCVSLNLCFFYFLFYFEYQRENVQMAGLHEVLGILTTAGQ